MMQTPDRARLVAPALLAAVAGSASVGIAALAREGLCFHRLTGRTRPDAMAGMLMDPAPMDLDVRVAPGFEVVDGW